MSIKRIIGRVFDAALILMLAAGPAAAQSFAAVLVWFMVAVSAFGLLRMDMKLAAELQAVPITRLVVAWTFHLAYVGALIVSGRPILAACYLIAVAVLRLTAHNVLKGETNVK